MEKVNELRFRLEAKPLHRGWERNWEKLNNSSREIAARNFDELTAHLNKVRRDGPFCTLLVTVRFIPSLRTASRDVGIPTKCIES